MTSQLHKLITACMIAGATNHVAFANVITVPSVPPNIQVPSGNKVYLKGSAVGTQNYICLASTSAPSGYAWTFLGPQATLFFVFQWTTGEVRQQIMTHFLSPNPDEGGIARATWQSSLDTSAIWARAIASSTDPNFVAPGAIPWLLLQIVGTQNGPTGGSSLTGTTFIQRVKTAGGVAPATDCSQSSNVGAVTMVPYTTDYYFYKAAN
jgi:hypothetical protein